VGPDDSGASIDEGARRRFEADWRAGKPGPIEAYLPPPADPRRHATLEELVFIEIECILKRRRAGDDTLPAHSIEAYLRRFPELANPDTVRRLVQEEWLVRHRFGETPSRNEYRSRFPTLFADADPEAVLPPVQSARPADDTEHETPEDLATPGRFPTIPGHEVLRLLGVGGMGAVYLAQQRRLGRLVALKVIRGGSEGAEELERFRSEAEAVARLQHPNVVQVFETGGWEPDPGAPPRPYFTMEYVPGGSLADRLDGRPRPPADAARLVETLARAIHAAHEVGIVHRDLKPANILLQAPDVRGQKSDGSTDLWHLTSDLGPKVTDFGLAKRLEQDSSRTRTGQIVGTPSYMAPEQAAGKSRQVGPAADVWALGAILYECLTGRPPFRGESAWDTLQQVLQTEPVPPRRLVPRLPRDLETVALKCLEKEPARRYASAAALADDLARFLAGEPIRARPVGSATRMWKWARRRPAAAGLVVVAALIPFALAAAGVWYADMQKRRAEESDRERQATFENFETAFDAINQMVAEARNDRLRGVPEAEEIVRHLLEKAVDFCRRLLSKRSDDPKLRRFTALAFRMVADVQRQTGEYDQAAESYRNAIDLHERLITDVPGEPQYAQDLSGTLINRSDLWYQRDRWADATADLERAITIRRGLADAYPDRPAYRRELAIALDNLGAHQSEGGRYPEAARQFAAALDILVPLRSKLPDDPETAGAFATCSTNAGLARWHEKKWDAAEKHLRDAAAVRRSLAAGSRDPSNPAQLAGTLNILGLVLVEAERPKDAEVAFREAIEIQRQLADKHPAIPRYHSDLGGTLQNLADQLRARDDAAGARRLLDEAIRHQQAALRASPTSPKYKEFLTNHYASLADTALDLGDHAAASAAAAGLADTGTSAQDAMDAASQTARCIPAVAKDEELNAERKAAKTAEYAEKAVYLLREAARRGFGNADAIRMNKDFAPLLDHPDFRQVLKDMKAGK
jgi:serine/threonine-protein kinase